LVNLEFLETADHDWNKRILQSKLGRYQQTTFQATRFAKIRKYKPLFILFKKADKIVGQQLLVQRPRGTGLIKKSLGKLTKKKFYFWNNSILIFDRIYQEEILQKFTNFIKDKEFIGFDNPIADYQLDLPKFKVGTVIIKIKKTFEETISGRDPTSTQKYVAMAAHESHPTPKGVTVKQIKTEKEIHDYYDMLIEHRKNLGIKTMDDLNSISDRIRSLNTNKCGGALLAYHHDLPISGIIYFNFNGWIHNLAVANTKYSLDHKLSSLDYLRCFLISIGVKTSAKFFDVGGISLHPQLDKEKRIRHSQTKWGGEIIEYNRYSNI